MTLDRRCAAAALLLGVAVTGCGTSHTGTSHTGSPRTGSSQTAPGQPSSQIIAQSPAGGSSVPSTGGVASSTPTAGAESSPAQSPPDPPSSAPSRTASNPPVTAVSIPPYLCNATDRAQNAADAYMGALSAGNAKQAAACVLPNTVPASVTAGLLARTRSTAVYLPRDGVDGPSVFGYSGNGKAVDVTVLKERDGKFWVTKVLVSKS